MKKIYLLIGLSVILMLMSTSSSLVNVIIYSLAVVPLAVLLGEFTSELSNYIGEKKGGLLTATIGNMPELMMGIWSIRFGMLAMTKAALIGSIISNLLLVLGISIFVGGIKYKEQKFNKIIARTNFNMLLLAMSAMVVMASLNSYKSLSDEKLAQISMKVSFVLILIYVLGLVFSLFTHSNLFVVSEATGSPDGSKKRGAKFYFLGLLVNSVLLFFISEKLINNLKVLVETYNVSQEFLGIVLIPILGNIGENISAIFCAAKNRVNLSIEIAIGSCMQISLFVTPLLIILSCIMNVKMNFLFSNFQIIACIVALAMSYFVFQDGKTYWLEGAIMIAIYLMITLGYYYVL